MKAIIDIKTPAGQSLEGFPETHELPSYVVTCPNVCLILDSILINNESNPDLHKGDKITIEIV